MTSELRIHRTVPARVLPLVILACLAVASAGTAGGQEEALTLRVNDAEAAPGGIAAVVLRTYSSRGIGQGQLCLGVHRQVGPDRESEVPEGDAILTELLAIRVYSAQNDARYRARFDPIAQTADAKFGSLTASINEVDGPLAVLYFRVSSAAVPGDRYDIGLLAADTFLIDGDGLPIPVSIRPGRLDIRARAEPYETGASAEDTVPGQVAFLGFSTREPFRIGEGQVGLEYDASLAAGPAEVFVDPRYGPAEWTVDEPVPGQLLIRFTSPNAWLGHLPGEILSVRVPTRPDIPPGTQSPVIVDPALTWLAGKDGGLLDIALENDVLTFVPPGG